MGNDMIGMGIGGRPRPRFQAIPGQQSGLDPQAQAKQMLTQQQGGDGAQLQAIAPQFGAAEAPDWGQMRPRFMANGFQRRSQY